MKVGLYFGTFNPIHVGHLVIANHMAQYTDLDQVWFVVSPQNPLKQKHSLLADYHRLNLANIAVEDNDALRVSDVEFDLPKPSYTTHTLAALEEKYPQYTFSLIMGEDNLRTLHKWKNVDHILEKYRLLVYPRVPVDEHDVAGENSLKDHPHVQMCEAPVMKVSASFVRAAIKEGKDVRYLLTESVARYVDEMNFYR